MPGVFLLQELRLQARHVHARRAIAQAALAGQAAVEDLCELRRFEDLPFHAPRQNLPDYIRPGARRPQFIARNAISRADCAAGKVGLAAVAAAVALLHRTEQGVALRTHAAHPWRRTFVEGGAPIVIGLVRSERRLHGVHRHSAAAQELVHRRRIHDLVQVEDPLRIPAAFQAAHHLIHLRAIHQRNELTPQTPVTVFAAQAALVCADQPGRTLRDLAELALSLVGLEVEDRAQMQFARTDMAVIDAIQAHLIQDGLEFRQISWQALRGDGRVFDDADRPRVALHAAQHTQARLAQFPDLAHRRAVSAGEVVRQAFRQQVGFQRRGPRVQFVPVQFGDQQGRRRTLDTGHQAAHARVGTRQGKDLAVDELDGRRIVAQGCEVGLVALLQAVAMGTDDHLPRRRQGV